MEVRTRPRGRVRQGVREDAFTLVTLLILVTVLNVVAAAAMPLWTQQVQREKEEELIFRGLQYAEAIRLFQTRVGRYPLRLEELLEIQPRSIRQLWKDPMTEDGTWGLVFAQAVQTPGGEGDAAQGRDLAGGSGIGGTSRRSDTGQPGITPDRGSTRGDRDSRRITTGPISGVHSLSDDQAIKNFMGGDSYSSWVFTADILPAAPTAPGERVPSLSSKWVGRPFPEGIEPEGGEGLDDDFGEDDEEEDPEEQRGRRRRGGRRGDDG